MLLKEGDIVLIADSQGVRDSYSASGFPVESSAPLSVLVNRGTASASEVRTCLLQQFLVFCVHQSMQGKLNSTIINILPCATGACQSVHPKVPASNGQQACLGPDRLGL